MCQFFLNIWLLAPTVKTSKLAIPWGNQTLFIQRLLKSKLSTLNWKLRFIFEEVCWLAQPFLFNRRPIFIKKRLPNFDWEDIQTEASELNLVTKTRNSEFRVFVKKPKNQVQSIGIKSSQMLKDLAPRVVQREKQHVNGTKRKRTFSIGSDVDDTQTTITKKSNDQNIPDTDGRTVAYICDSSNFSVNNKTFHWKLSASN